MVKKKKNKNNNSYNGNCASVWKRGRERERQIERQSKKE